MQLFVLGGYFMDDSLSFAYIRLRFQIVQASKTPMPQYTDDLVRRIWLDLSRELNVDYKLGVRFPTDMKIIDQLFKAAKNADVA
jgi:hypothetical protein